MAIKTLEEIEQIAANVNQTLNELSKADYNDDDSYGSKLKDLSCAMRGVQHQLDFVHEKHKTHTQQISELAVNMACLQDSLSTKLGAQNAYSSIMDGFIKIDGREVKY